MHTVTYIESHVAYACNLKCKGCSHFSDIVSGANTKPGELRSQLTPWLERQVKFEHLVLLGGEPFLNKQLREICEEARILLPTAKLGIVTNGLLAERQMALWETLKQLQIGIVVSVHATSPEYQRRAAEGFKAIKEWQRRGVAVQFRESAANWTARHKVSELGVVPFNDGKPKEAYACCPAKNSMQLESGQLWKCPLVTYVRRVSEQFGWQKAYEYRPLHASCSDEELSAFLNATDEPVCGLCPAALIPLRKTFM